MKLNQDLVGTQVGSTTRVSWSNHDTLVYALAVGAGQDDPSSELQFTTDNAGVGLRALPTFAATVAGNSSVPALLTLLGGLVNPAAMLHGDQSHEAKIELPATGSANATTQITSVWDKGSAAVVGTATTLSDVTDGSVLSISRQSMFFRGAGGWGGERGPRTSSDALVDRTPDRQLVAPTRRDQPLLYRLTGDSNPLHTDPAAARLAGFDQPIMHGMCVYGIAARLLTNELVGGDPSKFSSIAGRFTQVAIPGDALSIVVWDDEDGLARFTVNNSVGVPVLSNGTFEYHTGASIAPRQESENSK